MYSLCYQRAYIRLWSTLTTEANWLAEIMWLSWLCYYTCGHDHTRGFLPRSHGSETSVAVVWAKFLRKVQWAVWLQNEKVQDKLQGCLEKSLKWLLINYQILAPNFLLFPLWMTRRIWHCIKSHLRSYSTHPFSYSRAWIKKYTTIWLNPKGWNAAST